MKKARRILKCAIRPFAEILGNALWTHSNFRAPRQQDGVFAGNKFDTIGRDALQLGHATRVRIEQNTGVNIGYPFDAVDVENQGTPIAIDTAGNVDHSEYTGNTFEEINGQCIDLDGFHDGAVRGNRCTNRKTAADYPYRELRDGDEQRPSRHAFEQHRNQPTT